MTKYSAGVQWSTQAVEDEVEWFRVAKLLWHSGMRMVEHFRVILDCCYNWGREYKISKLRYYCEN